MKQATVFCCLSALLFANQAGATPPFPPEIETYLSTKAIPNCDLCHVGEQKASTAQTPFAQAMLDRGLIGYDLPSLRAALDKMEEDKVDSDSGGTIDIEELRNGNSPNDPSDDAAAGPTIEEVTPLTTGCGGQIARGGTAPLAPMAFALALLLARVRRFRLP